MKILNIKNIGFYVVVLVALLMACENDIKDIQAIDRKVDNVDRYKDLHITYSDSAMIRVTINAEVMESHFKPNGQQEDRFPKGVFVEFYNAFGQPESWLRAKNAIRYPNRDLVMVRDSVVLIGNQGDTLRTEELFWDAKEEEIYTVGAFRYANEKEIIFGYQFRSDQNFEEYTFKKMSGVMQAELGKR